MRAFDALADLPFHPCFFAAEAHVPHGRDGIFPQIDECLVPAVRALKEDFPVLTALGETDLQHL